MCSPRQTSRISIHALREEGDDHRGPAAHVRQISIHALREEGDQQWMRDPYTLLVFLSTPSARRATTRNHARNPEYPFLSTPSARRATADLPVLLQLQTFLSTPSARRATPAFTTRSCGRRDFYPRPPRGGRLIHRHEGAAIFQFLSTPSARRATSYRFTKHPSGTISIHALREEGDGRVRAFQQHPRISIHALREEGDQDFLVGMGDTLKFLSTPSARRATAKTETKSLFSNKLYNILHEFRRALIYNGSKSYPNHAK